jgi:hypothetical protein
MNIGCVVYKKDFKTGSLSADWRLAINGRNVNGTGKATGEPGDNYSGEYVITYFNSENIDLGTYNLTISEHSNCFNLEWRQDDKLKCVGTGMLYDNCLIAGWKNL